jgi:SAM-dependent methyltransferase
MSLDATRALGGVLRILLPVMDVLDGRVDDAAPLSASASPRPALPPWCDERGWAGFLLALDDGELRRCEAEGLAARIESLPGAPGDLVALAADVSAAVRLPAAQMELAAPPPAALRAVGARKQEQLAALLGAVGPMAERAARIVDVGAGSGHFTRLSAGLFAREAVGIERSAERVAAAVARAEELPPGAGVARFVTLDACREPLALAPDDLAVGLHACGALGDRLVTAAAEAGCCVVLISCCLQKIEAPARAPLSRAGAGLVLRKSTLGLTNLTAAPRGVEVSTDATLEAREARHALLGLLRGRGVELEPGEEMRGINRRRARAGLREIAERALALRGLAPPAEDEIRRHEDEARRSFARIRRLSLPRSMLARLVEIAVALDRAAALGERGQEVLVATLCDRAVTPRNIGLFASRAAGLLPRLTPCSSAPPRSR